MAISSALFILDLFEKNEFFNDLKLKFSTAQPQITDLLHVTSRPEDIYSETYLA